MGHKQAYWVAKDYYWSNSQGVILAGKWGTMGVPTLLKDIPKGLYLVVLEMVWFIVASFTIYVLWRVENIFEDWDVCIFGYLENFRYCSQKRLYRNIQPFCDSHTLLTYRKMLYQECEAHGSNTRAVAYLTSQNCVFYNLGRFGFFANLLLGLCRPKSNDSPCLTTSKVDECSWIHTLLYSDNLSIS